MNATIRVSGHYGACIIGNAPQPYDQRFRSSALSPLPGDRRSLGIGSGPRHPTTGASRVGDSKRLLGRAAPTHSMLLVPLPDEVEDFPALLCDVSLAARLGGLDVSACSRSTTSRFRRSLLRHRKTAFSSPAWRATASRKRSRQRPGAGDRGISWASRRDGRTVCQVRSRCRTPRWRYWWLGCPREHQST
jgi:hypothetical protein